MWFRVSYGLGFHLCNHQTLSTQLSSCEITAPRLNSRPQGPSGLDTIAEHAADVPSDKTLDVPLVVVDEPESLGSRKT